MAITGAEIDLIINTLLANDYISEDEIPDDRQEYRELALYWVREAEKAWKQNKNIAKNDEAIRTILNISPPDEPYVEPKATNNLPIPEEPKFTYTSLPGDFTELTDAEIRKFSSHNQHFLNRARYLLANITNHFADANHLKDEAYREAYKISHGTLVSEGERPTKDLINTYAMEDADYKKYDEDSRKALATITELKALVEIYSGNVERLSREWTMRTDEWEKSR